MGDVSRKMTTRTLQRPMRPDSETRDPTGGVTDRRDMMFTISRAGDRPETGSVLTSDLLMSTFAQTEQRTMIPERTETFVFNAESGAFFVEGNPSITPLTTGGERHFCSLASRQNGQWRLAGPVILARTERPRAQLLAI